MGPDNDGGDGRVLSKVKGSGEGSCAESPSSGMGERGVGEENGLVQGSNG